MLLLPVITAESEVSASTTVTGLETFSSERVKHSNDLETTALSENQPLPGSHENAEFDETVNRSQGTSAESLHARVGSRPSPLPISKAENPVTEPESEPEGTAEAWPEPGPDWAKAYKEWGAAWEIHVYLFAVIFLGFAVYSAVFIGHALYMGLRQTYLGFSLNVVMLILGFTRAFVLFTDPYLQGTVINNVHFMRVMWSLASPCLTSADCIVILSLLETANISLGPQRMQKFSLLIKIILLHFTLVLITNFIVSEFVEAKAMLVFCQVFYIIWGSVLGVGYFALAYKLDHKLFGHKQVKSKKELLYIRLIYASGINNFVLTAMFLYSGVGVFGVYSDVKFVEAWPWWAFQTCHRIIEVVSSVLVFSVSAKRKSLKKTGPEDKNGNAVRGGTAQSQQPITAKETPTDYPMKDTKRKSMLRQLYEAKIEAYHAEENV